MTEQPFRLVTVPMHVNVVPKILIFLYFSVCFVADMGFHSEYHHTMYMAASTCRSHFFFTLVFHLVLYTIVSDVIMDAIFLVILCFFVKMIIVFPRVGYP